MKDIWLFKRLLILVLCVMLMSVCIMSSAVAEAEAVPLVYAGGQALRDGEYLDNNGNISQEVPDGGYAYYCNGELLLKDYQYAGEGYRFIGADGEAYTSVLYSETDLTIVLEGTSCLVNTCAGNDGITVSRSDLMIKGSGTLNVTADYGIYAYDEASVNGGEYTGKGRVIVEGGMLNITAVGDGYAEGIYADGDITVTEGSVTISPDSRGMHSEYGDINVTPDAE